MGLRVEGSGLRVEGRGFSIRCFYLFALLDKRNHMNISTLILHPPPSTLSPQPSTPQHLIDRSLSDFWILIDRSLSDYWILIDRSLSDYWIQHRKHVAQDLDPTSPHPAQFIADSIRRACVKSKNSDGGAVVAVLGMAHVNGVQRMLAGQGSLDSAP
jgi:hypothetical protein